MSKSTHRPRKLQRRLLLALLITGLIPAIILAVVLVGQQTAELETQAMERLTTIRDGRRLAVEKYFGTIEGQISTFAKDRMVIDAMRDFPGAFESMGAERAVDEAAYQSIESEVSQYYQEDFMNKFRGENDGTTIDSMGLIAGLDEATVLAQYAYIAGNRYPLGDKHKLINSGNETTYDTLHERVHPSIRAFLEEFGYYDIFLADAKTGKVVYSVFKELDYGTSLVDGPYARSNIGEAFRAALATGSSDHAVLVDYESYLPSYNAPASFIASPIRVDGSTIGVAIFQLPLDRLTVLMSEAPGMGDEGDIFMVGKDGRLRSDSHRHETYTTVSSFRDGLQVEDEKLLAASESEGTAIGEDFSGTEVLLAYTPVKIGNNEIGLVAMVDTDYAFAAVVENRRIVLGTLVLVTLFIIAIALWLTRGISSSVTDIAATVTTQAKAVSQGNLLERSSPKATQFEEFEPILASINNMADAFTSRMDALPVPMIVHDREMRVSWANQAAADLARSQPSELVGRVYYETVPLEGWRDAGFITRRTLAEGTAGEAELACESVDGELAMRTVQTAIVDEEGRTQAVVETLIDQTAAKQSERRQAKISQFQAQEIEAASATLAKVAEGDLGARYVVTPVDDEALEAAFAGFSNIAQALRKTTEDFAVSIRALRSESDLMPSAAHELANLAETLFLSSETTASQATNVASATDEMSANVDSVAAAAEEMSINIGSVSENAAEMSSKMRSVAQAVETLAGSIDDVAERANNGSTVAGEAADKSHQANRAMETLGRAATEIGKVTEVIKRIAEKTNLLALNATIEAASAGEAGKGFAVVAHEIKELANQCATAAEDITDRIAGVQNNTDEAVSIIVAMAGVIQNLATSSDAIADSAQRQSEAVANISTNVTEVDQGVERTASAIAEIVQGANDVSRNAGELSRGAQDISRSIGEVSTQSSSSGDSAQQVGDAARQLGSNIEKLRACVAAFRVADSGPLRPAANTPPEPHTSDVHDFGGIQGLGS